MEVIGYLASILIGISLGLIGSGGSILTVPVLVYLFGEDPVIATGYSLFIVGITSMAGSLTYFKRGLINIKTAIIFGIPSILAVYITGAFIVPAIPDPVLAWEGFALTKRLLLMGLFAILMILASYYMIRQKKNTRKIEEPQAFNYPLIAIEGIVVGILTGLVGAGGGFLIIPALVILSKLSMKEAVGTSLLIIAAKSLIGFLGEGGKQEMNWQLLLLVRLSAIVGIVFGVLLSKRIDGAKLKPAFGWFVLIMGGYILVKEIFLDI